ncbi:TPA: hypothetical protein ACGTES_003463 [Salmonella enterica]
MPNTQLNTSVSTISPSTYSTRDDRSDNHKNGCFHKFRIRLRRNPEKSLNDLNYSLSLCEQTFSIPLYMGYKYKTIEACRDKLIREKIKAFGVTKDHPYVYNREAETKFLIALVNKNASRFEAGKFHSLQDTIKATNMFGKAVDKKRIQYREYQLMRDRRQNYFRNQPIDYKLQIEVMVNEYYKRYQEQSAARNQ